MPVMNKIDGDWCRSQTEQSPHLLPPSNSTLHRATTRIGVAGTFRMATMDATIEERFWSKVNKHGKGGCWEWTAATRMYGYGAFGECGKVVSAHRVSYVLCVGTIPKGKIIDHICHNPGCVNPEHLRLCTNAENSKNQKLKSTTKTGFKGVSIHKNTKKYRATITVNYKQVHLGYFVTKEEAHEAYCRAALDLHGEFANLGHPLPKEATA